MGARNGKRRKRQKVMLVLVMSVVFTYLTVNVFANSALNEEIDEALVKLSELIEFAQNRYTNSAEPGALVTVGRHPATARNEFQIAINDATVVMGEPDLTETEITAAYQNLNRAIEAFMNTMIDPGNAQNPNGFIRPYWREIARGEDELQKRHLRATWISTVVNIDWPSIEARGTTPDHVDRQKAELRTRFDEMTSMNMNAVIFQVGPTADAFYRSELVPWSAWLTGETNFKGNLYDSHGNSFDPLAYAIELAHTRNMELHAWLNPYRVSHVPASYTTRGGVPIILSSSGRPLSEHQAEGDNILQLIRDEWTHDFPGSAFDRFGDEVRIGENRYVLNPAIPDGRDWIVERVLEVVKNYDVDAIQFDDYFYPSDYFDDDSFLIFNTPEFNLMSGGVHTDHAAWRRENTEMMIIQVAEAIRATAPWVKFGISPVGVWRSGDGSTGYDGGGYRTGGLMQGTGSTSTTSFDNYSSVFADTRRWVIENKIDYLAPQIYWDWNLSAAPYGPIADWWGRLVHDFGPNGTKRNSQGEYTTTHIYLGLGLYRMDLDEFALDSQGFINGRREWTNSEATEFEGERTWMRQEHYNLGNPYIRGSMIFTQNQMRSDKGNYLPRVMETLKNTAWQQPALVPAMPHMGGLAPRNPIALDFSGNTLTWSDGETSTSELIRTRYFVIYRSECTPVDISDPRNIVAKVPVHRGQVDYSFEIPGGLGDYDYVVTAVNRLHDESDPTFVLVPDHVAPVISYINSNDLELDNIPIQLQGPIVVFASNITSENNGVREIEAILNIDGTAIDVSHLVRRQGTLFNTNITLSYRFAPEVILNELPVSLTITVTDGNDLSTSKTVALIVTAPIPPTLTTMTLENGRFHIDYSVALVANSTHPITWSIVTGSLPNGLILNESRGVISGRPTEYGDFTFTIRITNAYGGYDEKEFTITIAAPAAPIITTDTLPNGAIDILYHVILAATSDHPLTWSIVSGSLPDGLSLKTSHGEITGRPAAVGTFNFTIKAENPYGGYDDQSFTILITEEPEPRTEPNAYRFMDFENGEVRFVNTNWVTSGSHNNSLQLITIDVSDEFNADNDSRVYSGIGALHWEIRDSGQPASSLSGVQPIPLPQRDGANPTGIGFWIKITGSLQQLWGDRPVRMGLLNGGYKWWHVPVDINRTNEWQWVEVQFTSPAWNAGNVNFNYDPNQPLVIPGLGATNANAFLWLRKLNNNLMEADIYIDNITLLYDGITGFEANYDVQPPIVALTAINETLLGNGFGLLIEDMESGLDRTRVGVLVNGEDLADQLEFSPKELRATLILDALYLQYGENEVIIKAWDNFGFVTKQTFIVDFDKVSCVIVADGQFANQSAALGGMLGSEWRLCEDGTLEIDEGFINWNVYLGPLYRQELLSYSIRED